MNNYNSGGVSVLLFRVYIFCVEGGGGRWRAAGRTPQAWEAVINDFCMEMRVVCIRVWGACR